MAELPSGTVTFLFTDIEGSTKLAQDHPDKWEALRASHHTILQSAMDTHNGYVFQIIGDAFCVAFHTAGEALRAAVKSQTDLNNEDWGGTPVKVRIGIHTGSAELRGNEYYGYMTLARVQRVMSIAYGGQILLSNASAELTHNELPERITLRDMKEHRLKGLLNLEHLWQVVAPDLQQDFSPLQSLNKFPNNLPSQLTTLIGREKEISEVKHELSKHRLVTLTGSGGTGKTRLSLEVGGELQDAFPHGVWLVELASLSDPEFIPQAIASVLGLRDEGDRPLMTVLSDFLRSRTVLLLLDNCEHLILACAKIVETLLRACSKLTILASSREALGIQGERAFHVPSLRIPDENASFEQIRQCETVRLFEERAGAVPETFLISPENAFIVAQICKRLDGIPLAIELAAARVKVLPVEQIAARLDDRFRLLTGGNRTALPRQQTLRALIDWSYSLLTERERALLRRLSVFAGGWSLDAAEFICAGGIVEAYETLDLLTNLVDKSLITIEKMGGNVRYRRLETIRQYAREKFLETDEVEIVRDKHLDYYAKLAKELSPKIWNAQTLLLSELMHTEQNNFRQALAWGLETHPEKALWLIGDLNFFLALWLSPKEGQTWIKNLLERLDSLPPVDEETTHKRNAARAIGLMTSSGVSLNTGDVVQACETAKKAITLSRQVNLPSILAKSLGTYANSLIFMNDVSGTYEAASEARQIGLEYQDKLALSYTYPSLIWVALKQGDREQVQRLSQEFEQLTHGMENPITKIILMFMGMVFRWQGEHEFARFYLEKSRFFFSESSFKNLHYGAMAESELSHISRLKGNLQEAKTNYLKTLKLWNELGHRGAVANTLECLAFVANEQGQPARAATLLGAAEPLRTAAGAVMLEVEQQEYQQALASLKSQLGEEGFQLHWIKGQAMSSEEVIQYALNEGK